MFSDVLEHGDEDSLFAVVLVVRFFWAAVLDNGFKEYFIGLFFDKVLCFV
jgi:hypothetical protein